MRKVLIVGATSAIGERIARLLIKQKAQLYLTGRNTIRLETIATDLQVRGALLVHTQHVDVTQLDILQCVVQRAIQKLVGLDCVIYAAGLLPDQQQILQDETLLQATFSINVVSAMAVVNQAAEYFIQQGHGKIVVIGSVAGDRGRAHNAAYGAAKGALGVFSSAMRQYLHGKNVSLLLVKPGFVDTPMTANYTKNLLWAKPEKVAQDIVRAIKKNKSIVYTPGFWRWIMWVIKWLPEYIFIRLRF